MADSARGSASRIPSLDGLRALSIALVLISHLCDGGIAPLLLRRVMWHFVVGNTGVRVFFVISGFLITSLLVEERRRRGAISLRRFYLRRTLRLLPALYALLVALSVAAAVGIVTLGPADVVHAVTYTTNYATTHFVVAHTWSLSVEEQFYLLWPAVLAFAPRRATKAIVVVLLVAPVLRVVYTVVPGWPLNPKYTFETAADALAVGCMLALYREQLWAWRPYRALLTSRWMLLVPLFAALLVSWIVPDVLAAAVGISLLNFAIMAMVDWSMRNPAGAIGRVLNSAPMVELGVLSYSIYLWQQPFMDATTRMGTLPRLAWIAVAATLSYRFVERPMLNARPAIERRLVLAWRAATAEA